MQGLRVTEDEKQAVSEMIGYGVLSLSLSNDYYSFHREFDDHFRSGSLDAFHNAMALLMTEYSYTELEAGDILKREVLGAEKDLMEKYRQWEQSSETKSDDLRSYLILFILSIGGTNYWQAQTPRYSDDGFITTAEDRARLLQPRRAPVFKLEGHPPPAALNESQEKTVNGESHEAGCLGLKVANGTVLEVDVCAPFQVADADQVSFSPDLLPIANISDLHGSVQLYKCSSWQEHLGQIHQLPRSVVQCTRRYRFSPERGRGNAFQFNTVVCLPSQN
jgi:hypothetical protein